MKTISLSGYGPIISNEQQGAEIYNLLREELSNHEIIEVKLDGVIAMVTLCAKQIFGQLYKEMGSMEFKKRIKLSEANEDVKAVIIEGITNAIGL